MNSSELANRIAELTTGRMPKDRRTFEIVMRDQSVVRIERIGVGWRVVVPGELHEVTGGWGRHIRVEDRSWRDGTRARIVVGDVSGAEFRDRASLEVRPSDILLIREVGA